MKTRLNRHSHAESPCIYAFSLIFVILVYFISAYKNIPNLDYVAINGQFQNYNVIRRFLSGQIPFVDFKCYLGIGHLLMTSVVTFLLGGSFAAACLAYDFVSSLSVVLYCYIWCYIIFRKNWVIPFVLSLYFRLFDNLYAVIPYYPINSMMAGGTSARIIRALIIPVSITVFTKGSEFIESHEKWSEHKQLYAHVLLLSALGGLGVVWGNDYGIVSCIAIFLLVMLLTVIRFRSFKTLLLTCLVLFSGVSVTAFLISACVTRGHSVVWFKNNFLTASYHGWYYGDPKDRTLFFYEFNLSVPVIICSIVMIVYLVQLLRNISWKSIRYYGSIVFALLSCFGAIQEYHLFNLKDKSYSTFLIGTLIILAYIELLHCFCYFYKTSMTKVKQCFGSIVSIIGNLMYITFVLMVVFFTLIDLHKDFGSYKYYPGLGGHLDSRSDDLDKSLEIVRDRRVFSTYASALETVTGQFQSSGTDYIIHVLSDEERQGYLKKLNERDFDVVSTVNMHYSKYSLWIRNANWFFYREIYSQYHYIGGNSYADYWEYGHSPSNCYIGQIDAVLEKKSDSEYIIQISTKDSINGVADVYINYKTTVKPGTDSFFLHRTIIGVGNNKPQPHVLTQWSLRPSSQEYIPVDIVNGKGTITLSSYPVNVTSLEIKQVSCNRIFLKEALPN